MELTDIDFADDLTIDDTALEHELMRQPLLMFTYSSHYAEAIYEKNKAKESLDVCEARVDYEARKNPGLLGLDKTPTETAFKNYIKMHPKYLEALHKYQSAEYMANLLNGGVQAVNAKKMALENMVKLLLGSFYGEPRLEQDIREGIVSKAKEMAFDIQTKILNQGEGDAKKAASKASTKRASRKS